MNYSRYVNLILLLLQIELRTKMVEAKYHEDKLKLQQQHDVAVQKILDRKKHGIRGSEIPLQKQDNGNGSCYKEAGEEK